MKLETGRLSEALLGAWGKSPEWQELRLWPPLLGWAAVIVEPVTALCEGLSAVAASFLLPRPHPCGVGCGAVTFGPPVVVLVGCLSKLSFLDFCFVLK